MTHHPAEETLQQLFDAELAPAQAADAERHVAGCAACQEYVARLERLRRAVALLPLQIEPPSDMEAAIRARIDAPRPATQGAAPVSDIRPAVGMRKRTMWIGIAAALACIIAGALFVQHNRLQAPAPDSIAAADPDSHLLVELQGELERQRHLLAPETVIVVEQNLRTIDAAISATQGALAKDPSNSQLASMLEDSRRRRSDYIQTALDLASEI